MLIIRRTDSQIEFDDGQAKSTSVDSSRISSAMMAVERLASGDVVHILLLITTYGSDPLRLEGDVADLAEVYYYIVESMMRSRNRSESRKRLQ